MTKRWKLKVNSLNALLVLVTLLLVKAECAAAESPQAASEVGSSARQTHIYIGNDEISDYFFGSSISDNSVILEDVRKCLDSFQLFTCMKMLLLSRINDVVSLMEDPSVNQKDLRVLNGLVTFKVKNATANSVSRETNDDLNLDEEIANKMQRLFWRRSLLVNLLPKMKIEIEPSGNPNDNFLCFSYAVHRDEEMQSATDNESEGRRKKGGMSMMMIPPLIMLGLMPFTLASIKVRIAEAMVMNAVMINMMALNGAIFMTIRNLVFGPRKGDNVKYVNYGYSKDRQTQSRRPVLIIHSPAAFVKQPPVHRHRRPSASPAIQHYVFDGESYHPYHHQSGSDVDDHEDQHHFVRGNDYNYEDKNRYYGIGKKSDEPYRRSHIRSKRY